MGDNTSCSFVLGPWAAWCRGKKAGPGIGTPGPLLPSDVMILSKSLHLSAP